MRFISNEEVASIRFERTKRESGEESWQITVLGEKGWVVKSAWCWSPEAAWADLHNFMEFES